MNWITTNIRLPEDMYMRLKIEAAQKRTSIAALIREKFELDQSLSHKKMNWPNDYINHLSSDWNTTNIKKFIEESQTSWE